MGIDRRGLRLVALGGLLSVPMIAQAQSFDDLNSMSIEQLANVDVTSMTKSAASLSDTPGSLHVITRDEILRSGVTTLPEALRLAPNLQVARRGAADWVITARGMSGNSGAQNFANKLLVLIDGRSVYTPLYSGVYWDMQDVVLADIDRIEVISGPGATLWGANAVNGVINIITRKSAETQGLMADLIGGNREQSGTLRYGGTIGDGTTFRVYAKAQRADAFAAPGGASDGDWWQRLQGGFRGDWTPGASDTLTLQGDAYAGTTAHPGNDERIAGRNLTARWRHATAGGDNGDPGGAVQLQVYYDRTMRADRTNGRFALDTYDLDLQHDFAWGPAQHIVWGGGLRLSDYAIDSIGALSFAPSARNLFLGNGFVQDSIAISRAATLVVGLKAEDDPYVGVALLPSVRGSLKLGPNTTLWAAVSRAIRSPTPFDRDVVERIGSLVYLTGSSDFRSEKLTAYEAGLRGELGGIASFSLAGFYNVYDDLRSIEIAPGGFLPLRWGNRINARNWGFEADTTIKPASWWRLTAGFAYLHEDIGFDPNASGLLGAAQIGDDPRHQETLRSSMDLGDVTLDADLRHVVARPDPFVPAYVEAGARIGWRVSKQLTLSVTGENLLHQWHVEYAGGERVPRSVLFGVRWH